MSHETKNRRALVGVTFAIALSMASLDAKAVFGLLYAEAKVNIKTEHQIVAGLDDKTRAMILGLPDQARAQAIKFLQEAVPLVNEGLAQFLARLDSVLENRINGLVCSGQGLAKGVAEELGAAWRKERPKPLIELAVDFDTRKGFDSKSARYLTFGYYDFLHNAAVTSCQLADGDAKSKVERMRAEARQHLRIWEEIEGICTTPAECLSTRYSSITELLAKSDRRDVENAEAKPALAAVKLVQVKSGVLPWITSLVGKTHWVADDAQWVAYEAELGKLRLIERSVDYARSLRQQTAKARLATVLGAIVNSEAALISIASTVSTSSIASNSKAEQDAIGLVKAKATWIAELARASANDSGLKSEVDGATQRLKALEVSIVSLTAQVTSNNKLIAEREAEQARLRDERRQMREAWRRPGKIID